METKMDAANLPKAKKTARTPKTLKIDVAKDEAMEKPKRHRRSRSGKLIVPCTGVATILAIRDLLS